MITLTPGPLDLLLHVHHLLAHILRTRVVVVIGGGRGNDRRNGRRNGRRRRRRRGRGSFA